MATQQPLQLQPSLLTQSGQQQYVPVSMVEQPGRQVLLAAAQGAWPNNRQMTLVPSWQQLPAQHSAAVAALRQPLLQAETSEWGRPLLVDSSTVQDQRSVFPVDLPEVYDNVVDPWSNSKRVGAGAPHKSALFTLQVFFFFK